MHKKNATALTSGSGSLTYYWAKVEKKRKSYKKIPTTAREMGKGRNISCAYFNSAPRVLKVRPSMMITSWPLRRYYWWGNSCSIVRTPRSGCRSGTHHYPCSSPCNAPNAPGNHSPARTSSLPAESEAWDTKICFSYAVVFVISKLCSSKVTTIFWYMQIKCLFWLILGQKWAKKEALMAEDFFWRINFCRVPPILI